MKTNKASASEINLGAQSYIPKKQLTIGTLHLKSLLSAAKGFTSDTKYRLTPAEEAVCDMATD